jgi:hypothetical protein
MEVDTAVPDTVQDVLCTSTPCFFTQHLHVIFKSSKHNGANLGGDSKLVSFKKKHKACLLLPPTNTPDSKNSLFQISSTSYKLFRIPLKFSRLRIESVLDSSCLFAFYKHAVHF